MQKFKQDYDFKVVITLSDIVAIGICEAAKELKFRIPEDYSEIGYDNIMSTSYFSPPLTTIHQPKIRTGVYIANILLEQIERKSTDFKKVVLEPRLIKRKTVVALV
ncbi:MAG: substrate-binding domain-containing protein [Actinomycetota bacterium]